MEDMTQWFRKYGDDVQKFAALKTSQESHKFLLENMHLVCDHMASYLVIFCVDLEVEEVRCVRALDIGSCNFNAGHLDRELISPFFFACTEKGGGQDCRAPVYHNAGWCRL